MMPHPTKAFSPFYTASVFLLNAILLAFPISLLGQNNVGCPNADFSMNGFQNWIGGIGNCCPINITNPNTIQNGRHTIMTPGLDPIINALTRTPPGISQSARLGNSQVGAQAESLRYSFTVTQQNALFIYRYAVVMQDPGHSPVQQPRFEMQVKNQNGGIIPCTFYQVAAGGNVPGFVSQGQVRWRNWTTTGVNLLSYVGQVVTIEARTGDCSLSGHYGYGYLAAECRPLQIDITYCVGDTVATLVAPPGFVGYQWSNGATTQQIAITNPTWGQNVYQVTLTSATGCTAQLSANINPVLPNAHFFTQNLCNGTLQFNDSTTIPGVQPAVWNWDFGDGSPNSSQQNPIHQYGSPGTYNVTLISSAQVGCEDTVVLPVVVPPILTPDFVFDSTCGMVRVFTDSSSISQPGNLVSWSWAFGDGTFDTLQSPSHTYSSPGTYNVELVVTDNNGCADTIVQPITMYSIPNANFTFNNVCHGQVTPFVNTSNILGGGLMNHVWSFGNGNTSVQGSPWHTYANPGTYTVQLIVTGPGGCKDTAVQSVTVHPRPVASFTMPPPCGLTGQITNTTTIAPPSTVTGNQWTLGNGQTSTLANPNFNYANPGTYTVTLTATSNNGCTGSVTQQVTRYAIPVASFTAPQTCHGNSVPFTNSSTIQGNGQMSYNWNLGNGQTSTQTNPNMNYVNPGQYSVSLIATGPGGCSDTATQVVNVPPTPVADFNLPPSCGLSGSISSTSLISPPGFITSYSWNFGNGQTANTANANYNYASPGVYNIQLIVVSNQGCRDTIVKPFTVWSVPTAAFTGPQTCHGNPVPFQDNSTIVNSTLTNWNWNYGNGQSSTQQNPNYSYPTHGVYNVTLIVTGQGGCTDTITQTVNVPPTPVANFTLPDSCGLLNSFANLSTISNPGSIVSHAWNFGNGQTSNQQNPSHQYTIPGPYNITLVVVSNEGCSDTLVKPFVTWSIPQAAFAVPQTCYGSFAPFTDQSTIPNSTIASWNWNFGNGQTSTQQNPSHFYANHGTYTVTLVVAGVGGCTDTVTQSLLITPKPVANFALPASCGMIAPFTNQSTISNPGTIQNWSWNFGNGQTSTQTSPTYTYPSNGTWNVTLIVTSNQGCLDTVTIPYTNYHWPQAAMSVPNVCHGVPTLFTDQTTVTNGTVAQWFWDYGNGATGTQGVTNHTYQTPGTYPVQLIVISANGCADTAYGNTTVHPLPQPDFSAPSQCSRETVTFTNSSIIQGGSITSYIWDFATPTLPNSFVANPTAVFPADGTYMVTLVATSNQGCIDSIIKPVSIYPRPRVGFTPYPFEGCAPLFVNFTNNTTIPGNNSVTSYLWNFGNGQTATMTNPTQYYMTPGLYTVSLYANSDKNCDTTVTLVDTIKVYTLPNAEFAFSPENPTIVQRNLEFTNLSQGNPTQFYWEMGEGSTYLSQHVSHVYPADTGTYVVYLWIATDKGCSDSTYKTVRINSDFTVYIPNSFSPNNDGTNDAFMVHGRGIVEADMWIFNRWGEEVAYLKNLEPMKKGWDGQYIQGPAKQDIYVYRIIVRDFYGEYHEFRGNVNLLR